MIVSVVVYLYAMVLFIDAYAFTEKFWACPAPQFLLDKAVNNVSEFDAQGEILATMSETMEINEVIIQSKVDKGQQGFVWLKRAIFTTLFIIILFLFALF